MTLPFFKTLHLAKNLLQKKKFEQLEGAKNFEITWGAKYKRKY